MDASFLNFHQEETFQAFHSTSYYLDDIYDDLNDQTYGWESERDLTSDMGGTPPSEGTGGLSDRSASPQHVEIDNMLLLEKWTQHISSLEIPNVSDLSDVCGSIQTADAQEVLSNNVFCDKLLDKDATLDLSHHFENVDPIGHLADADFDITKYVNEPDKTEEALFPEKPGGKKIDMKNCRYIVKDELESEEDVDVETLSECDDTKDNLFNLDSLDRKEFKDIVKNDEKVEVSRSEDFEVGDKATKVTSFDIGSTTIHAGDLVSLLEQFEASESKTVKNDSVERIWNNVGIYCKTKGKKIRKPVMKAEENIKHIKVKDKQIPTKHTKVKEKIKNIGKPSKIQEKLVTRKLGKMVDKKCKATAQKMRTVIQKPINKDISCEKPLKSSINTNQKINNELLQHQQRIVLDPSKLDEKKCRIIKEIPVIQPEHVQKVVEIKKVIKKDQKTRQETPIVLKKLPPGKQFVETNISNDKRVIIAKEEKSNQSKKITTINATTEQNHIISTQKVINAIHLDHDYCISIHQFKNAPISNNSQQRSILRNQPTVKTADGKLMVSLLKVNTIKTGDTKKKLNLEEYKKRRQNRLVETDKRKVASDKFWGLDPYPKLPKNLEMKTYVSIGVNTDQTWAKVQEITKGNSVNFSPNSLIASMVERLPGAAETQPQIAENKTIVYLDKNRPKKETCNKRVQTDIIRRRSRLSSSSSSSSRSSRSSSRSVSPANRKRRRTSSERVREVEERRVIYVGRIANGTTQEDLRRRFYKFGPINYVSVHFRRTGDNYGFVTFRYKEDAYEAVEHGNDDPTLPHYDLSFGGRRVFCKTTYADLDNMRDDYMPHAADASGGTFEELLREFQVKVRNKKIRSS